jgi:aureolysin
VINSKRRFFSALLFTVCALSLNTTMAREPRQNNADKVHPATLTAALLAGDENTIRTGLLPTEVNAATTSRQANSKRKASLKRNNRSKAALAVVASKSPGSSTRSQSARPKPTIDLSNPAASGKAQILGGGNAIRAVGQTKRISILRGENGTVRVLRGSLGAGSVQGKSRQANNIFAQGKAFIAANSTLFEIADPEQTLRLKRQWTDSIGHSHVVYQRQINGVPVLNEEIALHAKGQDFYYANSRYNNLAIASDSTVKLTPDEAWSLVISHLGVDPDSVLHRRDPELQLTESGDTYRYVYQVKVLLDDMMRWSFILDAGSGDVLDARKDIRTQLVSASGIDALGQQRSFTAWQEGEAFYLVDPSTPTADSSYDPLNSINNSGDQVVADARNADDFDTLYFSNSSNRTSGWDPVGISVFANTRQTYDYYLDAHGRDSIDGKGMNLFSIVHFKRELNNAFWNGVYMVYGDGDGSNFSQLGACLDVVAHELTHGVIETTAGLVYRNQSGALNESFADIMAAMIDREDWLLGEDCVLTSPRYLRSMSEPESGLEPQPGHMNDYQHLPDTQAGDWGGVHVNSGIPNRAAYLVAEGLSEEGRGVSIGREKTEQIFYRALSTYLTSTSEFIDARAATLQAAEDLYGAGSQEQLSVRGAWEVVGVGEDGGANPGPGVPIEGVEGEDFIAYHYPIDGANDFSEPEYFDLYVQAIPAPFPGYDPELDFGPLNVSQYTNGTAPAPVSVNGDLVFLYVGLDGNVYLTDSFGNEEVFLDDGENYSVAVSPDRRFVAVTPLDLNDNVIWVYDYANSAWRSHTLETPNYSDSEGIESTALYAESIAFDYTGRRLIYDYVTCLPSPLESCDPETAFGYWSIGVLDVESGRFSFPFPAQSPDFDVGYPRYANTTSRFFAFDVNDYTNYASSGAIDAFTLVFDTFEQELELVGVPNLDDPTIAAWGVPSFSGDDDYLVYQVRDALGTAGMRAGLDNYAWDGELEVWNDFDVVSPVAHRNANRVVAASLSSDKSQLDFGSVPTSERVERKFTLTNIGNRPIDITDVSVTGEYFRHNMSNKTLPANQSIEVSVKFTPGRVGGDVSEVMTIDHDGDNFELAINLVAVVTGSEVDVDPLDTNGNSRLDWNEGIVVDGALTVGASDMRLLRLYTGALGRVPDLGGFRYWRDRIATGTDFSRMGDEFFWSEEMQIQMDADGDGTVSDEEFMNHLYFNVLQRAPDAGGFNYWMGRLGAGDSVGTVMASFLNGQEYVDSTMGLLANFALSNPGEW